MKKRLLIAVLGFVLIVTSALSESMPFPEDYNRVLNYSTILDSNGVITSVSAQEETQDTNAKGERILSYHYNISDGADASITYKDGGLYLFTLSIDPYHSYIEANKALFLLCFTNAVTDCDSDESLSVLEYLIYNQIEDPISGTSCELNRGNYTYVLNHTDIDTWLYYIYPVGTSDSHTPVS